MEDTEHSTATANPNNASTAQGSAAGFECAVPVEAVTEGPVDLIKTTIDLAWDLVENGEKHQVFTDQHGKTRKLPLIHVDLQEEQS